MHPAGLLYSKHHEWVKADKNIVTVGITDYAQTSLGDVVFVELPGEGDVVTAEKPYGSVESVKSISDLVTSVDGRVVSVNEGIMDSPDLLNSDPYGEGWLIKLEASDLRQLDGMMTAAEYESFVAAEGH